MKQENKYLSFQVGEVAAKAIPALNVDQRIEVLRHVHEGYGNEKVVRQLVGNNIDIYRELLSLDKLSCYHLSPLEGPPEQGWSEKALAALDAGYPPSDIAHATLPGGWSWTGRISMMWDKWTCMFEELHEHPDFRIAQVGKLGAETTGVWRDSAIEEERNEDIHGV
jgi:hypothetical protein